MRKITLVAAATLLIALAAPAPVGAAVDPDGWDRRSLPSGDDALALVGNFGGDDATDILWFRPGPGIDEIWYGRKGVRGQSNMVKRRLHIDGTYQPIVGDFTGNSGDDIIWYAPGSARDALWTGTGAYDFGAKTKPLRIDADYTWATLQDHRGGKDDVAFIGKGDLNDYIWHFDDSGTGTFQYLTVSVPGTHQVLAGDYDGNGYDDVFLYAPGHVREEIWRSAPVGHVSRTTLLVDRTLDLTTVRKHGGDDLLVRSDESTPESVWKAGSPPFALRTPLKSFDGPATATWFGRGKLLLYGPDVPETVMLDTDTTGGYEALADPSHDQTDQTPLVGDFDADGNLDIAWYSKGSSPDSLWYAQPAA